MNDADGPHMFVLAGPNGSGKSSVLGKKLRDGIDFLNSDREALRIAKEERGLEGEEARQWIKRTILKG